MPFTPTFSYRQGVLSFLDQQLLPNKSKKLNIKDHREVIDAIKKLKIRGAPAIGIAGAYAMVLASRQIKSKSHSTYMRTLLKAADKIESARPTAINLAWSVGLMRKAIENHSRYSIQEIVDLLEAQAQAILNEDNEIGVALGKVGSRIIKKGDGILTHCNAGGLATGGMGSALSSMYYARQQNTEFVVYVDETRPLLQGARLTTYELKQWGINYYLICDNMSGHLMARGKIQKVITGADRIALNGDSANKIGTYSLAILAKYHKIPFYIAAPYSTFDANLKNGEKIPIEERGAKEVTHFKSEIVATKGSKVFNPAFDVVPAQLITGIITERGVIDKPNEKKIKAFFKKSR